MKVILLVEDNKDIAECLRKILSHAQYQVIVAANGKEGLAKAERSHPDLILMDFIMPDQDGAETVREIRARSSLSAVPIIFLTSLAAGDESGISEMMVSGQAYPVLSKMTPSDEILRQVNSYLYAKS